MFSVKFDYSEFEKFGQLLTDVIPLRVAVAMTDTVKDARTEIIKHMETVIDRPKSFTTKGMYIIAAEKKDPKPKAVLGFKDIQAKYLKWLVEGGTQTRDDNPLSPVNIGLTKKHGNIIGLKGGRVFKNTKGTRFKATIKGTDGLWLRLKRTKKRGAGGVKLLIAFRDKKVYSKKPLKFYTIFAEVAKNKLPKHFNKQIRRGFGEGK